MLMNDIKMLFIVMLKVCKTFFCWLTFKHSMCACLGERKMYIETLWFNLISLFYVECNKYMWRYAMIVLIMAAREKGKTSINNQ